MKKLKIAAVVVLYNPDENSLENIYSYLDNVEQLYIIDNSESYNTGFLNKFNINSKVKYISMDGNQGIAEALNRGCLEAIKDGYEWILTMDQDSIVTEKMLQAMIGFLHTARDKEKISIVSPYHANFYFPKSETNNAYSEIITTMTSGNLLNLLSYKNIGPFREDFFIDYVDNEYCLRSRLKGYKIIQVNNAVLDHNLGEISKHVILKKSFYMTNHSALRLYYRTRNRFYLYNEYKYFFKSYIHEDKINFLKDFIRMLLFEDKKLKKTYYIILGYIHAKQKRLGKHND